MFMAAAKHLSKYTAVYKHLRELRGRIVREAQYFLFYLFIYSFYAEGCGFDSGVGQLATGISLRAQM